jgi:hypothetical protein
MYEYGEPWRNDIDRGKLTIRPPEFSCNPTRSHLVTEQDELEKEIIKYVVLRIFIAFKIHSFGRV